MDGNGRAADLQVDIEELLADVRISAEEYIRLRLAREILSRAMERYREQNQDPVLSRAARLFSELTLGAFSGLRADHNEQGHPVLVGIRAGTGQTVDVSGMSDGTCDQLYLAVRLALLERSLSEREPMPFIVDDILVLFDDERAAAALKVLLELSRKTQVIFFTHHARLVELVETTLPRGVAQVVKLPRKGAVLAGK